MRSLLLQYGLIGGLFLGVLYSTVYLFFFWPFFILYFKIRKKYDWNNNLADSIVYSWMSAFGLSLFIHFWLDAINDICWLLFHTCPDIIITALGLSGRMFHLAVTFFFILFLIVHQTMKRTNQFSACFLPPFFLSPAKTNTI